MKIKDTLRRDPTTHPLVNQGQARIADRATEREVLELQGELSTFVCEGEYAEGIQRILSAYLANRSGTTQKAAWVSGFYGSGKSHLLKMLCHLWQNTVFADGSTARALVPVLTDEIKALLRELDTAGKRSGGLLASAGSLSGGTTDNVRLTVLSVLLRGAGFPEQYAQARFVLWLHERGFLDQVRGAVEKSGREWSAELNNLYVSKLIAKAVLACDKEFASNEAEAKETIREQFKQPTSDLTTVEFLAMVRQVLALKGKNGRFPCSTLILDEVQMYIGSSPERSTLVTEVVEALNHQLDGQMIVVGAGQSALSAQPLLHKLLDRFPVRVQLSDTDVEAVTRKVLLQKQPAAVSKVNAVLEKHAGEIARQLQGTRIGARGEDQEIIVDDYPLLPVRRRFWEHVFRAIDLACTHSQLRSQLWIIHDGLTKVSDRELGALVPGDELYAALAPEMVNTGVLLRELSERIAKLGDGTAEGRLKQRLCGLVFLIGRLPREDGADIGVRATPAHLADLLIDDLSANNGKLRDQVAAALQSLAADGTLMQVGDEYRLQTREGAEWDKEYRNGLAKLNNDEVTIQTERDKYLYSALGEVIGRIKVLQGKAKEARRLEVSRDQTPPPEDGEGIPVWIRDGWSITEKSFVAEARRVGTVGATIYIFLSKPDDADLRQAVLEALAADRTLGLKGHPTGAEGQEARNSIDSRLKLAMHRRAALVQRIVASAKVFQGGGSEVLELTLEDRVHSAADASKARLYPRFGEADAPAAAWEEAQKRARDGADQPFQPVGHTGPIEEHPVCRQVLQSIGSGCAGTAVRKALRASPFGWPQDAIDAALMALHRSQHLSALLNGVAVAVGQLDQNKIPKAEFRAETFIIPPQVRWAIRAVFTKAGLECRSGEELGKTPGLVASLAALHASTGGDAPLPGAKAFPLLDELRALSGNELLLRVGDKATDLQEWIEKAKQTAALAAQRLPAWEAAQWFVRHAQDLPEAADLLKQVLTVEGERQLLAKTDPVAPLRAGLAALLRKALLDANRRFSAAYSAGVVSLDTNTVWQGLPEADRQHILRAVLLALPVQEDVGSDEGLLSALDRQSLAARASEADAVPGRVQRALEEAARKSEPKVRTVTLERATLRSEADVRAWAQRQEAALLAAVKQGPVLVN